MNQKLKTIEQIFNEDADGKFGFHINSESEPRPWYVVGKTQDGKWVLQSAAGEFTVFPCNAKIPWAFFIPTEKPKEKIYEVLRRNIDRSSWYHDFLTWEDLEELKSSDRYTHQILREIEIEE